MKRRPLAHERPRRAVGGSSASSGVGRRAPSSQRGYFRRGARALLLLGSRRARDASAPADDAPNVRVAPDASAPADAPTVCFAARAGEASSAQKDLETQIGKLKEEAKYKQAMYIAEVQKTIELQASKRGRFVVAVERDRFAAVVERGRSVVAVVVPFRFVSRRRHGLEVVIEIVVRRRL